MSQEAHAWLQITDLPQNLDELRDPALPALIAVWKEQSERLRDTEAMARFLGRLRRQLAIETGIVERLYTIDRGITQTLIEHGIDATLIPHGTTDRPASEIVTLIKDHELAIEAVFDLVAQRRPLSTSYVKQLHQILTAHQATSEAIDHLGRHVDAALLRGEWKRLPNNPAHVVMDVSGGLDSKIKHEYCPPEHVASEMDNLIRWHLEHLQRGVPAEVEAAWLHHRFTQIHPFQDGNGRVARCLATLVFLRAGWFPLVITRDDLTRGESQTGYIEALEQADAGDLRPLVQLFVGRQRRAFVQALSVSEQVISEGAPVAAVLASAREVLARRREDVERRHAQAFDRARHLHAIAKEELRNYAQEVDVIVKEISETYRAWSYYADHGQDSDRYHRFQIIQGANELNYYANLRDFRAWAVLAIQMEVRTEILISFHGIGHEFRGVLIASGIAYQKDGAEIAGVHSVCREPFEITYAESNEQVAPRFRSWLEHVIAAGLEEWRRSL